MQPLAKNDANSNVWQMMKLPLMAQLCITFFSPVCRSTGFGKTPTVDTCSWCLLLMNFGVRGLVAVPVNAFKPVVNLAKLYDYNAHLWLPLSQSAGKVFNWRRRTGGNKTVVLFATCLCAEAWVRCSFFHFLGLLFSSIWNSEITFKILLQILSQQEFQKICEWSTLSTHDTIINHHSKWILQ